MNFVRNGVGPVLCGTLFAIGLGVSGMTEPKNIIGFLDVFGDWQGELLFVMGGAIVVYAVLSRFILKKAKPLFEASFLIPTRMDIDRRLIIGALLFGAGWGIAGLCPGPGIVSLMSWEMPAIVFMITMIVGMALGRSKIGLRLFDNKQ